MTVHGEGSDSRKTAAHSSQLPTRAPSRVILIHRPFLLIVTALALFSTSHCRSCSWLAAHVFPLLMAFTLLCTPAAPQLCSEDLAQQLVWQKGQPNPEAFGTASSSTQASAVVIVHALCTCNSCLWWAWTRSLLGQVGDSQSQLWCLLTYHMLALCTSEVVPVFQRTVVLQFPRLGQV